MTVNQPKRTQDPSIGQQPDTFPSIKLLRNPDLVIAEDRFILDRVGTGTGSVGTQPMHAPHPFRGMVGKSRGKAT